ncbi:symmetrical bis(5'-nucleosyl)-tetraphosphatase [Vibrio sp.]|nr:symmetrical bis(5'-nucleosyl)-tetraphosphatase [Vibrio sp.]
MANYIVGDIQGCFDELQLLLKKASFDPELDTLWFAGDLVARGPKSLETLRFAYSLGSRAKVILGNHDLHLLAVSLGIHPIKTKDKTRPIFSAPDKNTLLTWLRNQPLLAEHEEFVLTHAGISPLWNLETARIEAKSIETILRSDDWEWLIEKMYSNQPSLWDESLDGLDRLRYSINAFTRMRFVKPDGSFDFECKLPPKEVKSDSLIPWFKYPQRKELEKTILFGHWAALNGVENETVVGLDTGCVWGGHLTMLRWEDRVYFTQPALK